MPGAPLEDPAASSDRGDAELEVNGDLANDASPTAFIQDTGIVMLSGSGPQTIGPFGISYQEV